MSVYAGFNWSAIKTAIVHYALGPDMLALRMLRILDQVESEPDTNDAIFAMRVREQVDIMVFDLVRLNARAFDARYPEMAPLPMQDVRYLSGAPLSLVALLKVLRDVSINCQVLTCTTPDLIESVEKMERMIQVLMIQIIEELPEYKQA